MRLRKPVTIRGGITELEYPVTVAVNPIGVPVYIDDNGIVFNNNMVKLLTEPFPNVVGPALGHLVLKGPNRELVMVSKEDYRHELMCLVLENLLEDNASKLHFVERDFVDVNSKEELVDFLSVVLYDNNNVDSISINDSIDYYFTNSTSYTNFQPRPNMLKDDSTVCGAVYVDDLGKTIAVCGDWVGHGDIEGVVIDGLLLLGRGTGNPPTTCPSCDTDLSIREDESLYCSNVLCGGVMHKVIREISNHYGMHLDDLSNAIHRKLYVGLTKINIIKHIINVYGFSGLKALMSGSNGNSFGKEVVEFVDVIDKFIGRVSIPSKISIYIAPSFSTTVRHALDCILNMDYITIVDKPDDVDIIIGLKTNEGFSLNSKAVYIDIDDSLQSLYGNMLDRSKKRGL